MDLIPFQVTPEDLRHVASMHQLLWGQKPSFEVALESAVAHRRQLEWLEQLQADATKSLEQVDAIKDGEV